MVASYYHLPMSMPPEVQALLALRASQGLVLPYCNCETVSPRGLQKAERALAEAQNWALWDLSLACKGNTCSVVPCQSDALSSLFPAAEAMI